MFSFYAAWRAHHPDRNVVSERSEQEAPPEKLMQAVWSQQRLRRHALSTLTGEPVKVLHPGFWNTGPGPDFSGAILQIGDQAPIEGDVEIDVRSNGWKAHGHDRNPDFANVVLHVVWRQWGSPIDHIPTIELSPALDAPLSELDELLRGALPPPLPAAQQGRCCAPLQQLPPTNVVQILEAAARVRLESRAAFHRARAREIGWKQTLIEGMFRGLGYKNNTWPFQRLGELIPTIRERCEPGSTLHWQAALLGTAGLLPHQVGRRHHDSQAYLKRIWDVWWREQSRCGDLILPRSLWRMRGLRPANQPQRRIALAAHWVNNPELLPRLQRWFEDLCEADPPTLPAAAHQLAQHLSADHDPFWESHWTLNARPMPKPQPLLGPTRSTDIAVNVLIPWFLSRAQAGRNEPLQRHAERIWFAWPKAEDNSTLRQARSRLLGNARATELKTAAQQQGLIQITQDFCNHSNAICESCRFPMMLKHWQGSQPGQ